MAAAQAPVTGVQALLIAKAEPPRCFPAPCLAVAVNKGVRCPGVPCRTLLLITICLLGTALGRVIC